MPAIRNGGQVSRHRQPTIATAGLGSPKMRRRTRNTCPGGAYLKLGPAIPSNRSVARSMLQGCEAVHIRRSLLKFLSAASVLLTRPGSLHERVLFCRTTGGRGLALAIGVERVGKKYG